MDRPPNREHLPEEQALASQASAIGQGYKQAVQQGNSAMKALPKTEALTQQTSAMVGKLESQAKQTIEASASAASKARATMPSGGGVDIKA